MANSHAACDHGEPVGTPASMRFDNPVSTRDQVVVRSVQTFWQTALAQLMLRAGNWDKASADFISAEPTAPFHRQFGWSVLRGRKGIRRGNRRNRGDATTAFTVGGSRSFTRFLNERFKRRSA